MDSRYRTSFDPDKLLPSGVPDWSGSLILLGVLAHDDLYKRPRWGYLSRIENRQVKQTFLGNQSEPCRFMVCWNRVSQAGVQQKAVLVSDRRKDPQAEGGEPCGCQLFSEHPGPVL